MRVVLAISCAVFSVGISASPFSPFTEDDFAVLDSRDKICNYLATQSQLIAEGRDLGVSESETRGAYAQSIAYDEMLSLIFGITSVVYEYPRFKPEEEAYNVFEWCISDDDGLTESK